MKAKMERQFVTYQELEQRLLRERQFQIEYWKDTILAIIGLPILIALLALAVWGIIDHDAATDFIGRVLFG